MPSKITRAEVLQRDGYHCRFCGIPVIPEEVRKKAHSLYPSVVRWGRKSEEQHAAFQALWLQFDHLVPHSRGGTNEVRNIVVACAPCNYGRGNFLLNEVGISDPFLRPPVKSMWQGLAQFVKSR
ncbi:HNH endonuclease [Litoreibacter ponti]